MRKSKLLYREVLLGNNFLSSYYRITGDATFQNEQLTNIIYGSDWYDSTKEIKKCLLVIGQRLQRLDCVCVFRSKTFELSKSSFIWVSVYMVNHCWATYLV